MEPIVITNTCKIASSSKGMFPSTQQDKKQSKKKNQEPCFNFCKTCNQYNFSNEGEDTLLRQSFGVFYYIIPADSLYAESTVCRGFKKMLQSRGMYHHFSSCKWFQKCYLIADKQIQCGMYFDSQREKESQRDRWGGFVCDVKKCVTILVND